MNAKQIIENAKSLSPSERALVARCFISSLDTKQDDGVEQAWAELAEKRYSELISGEIDSVSWEVIKRKIKPE